MKLLGIGSNAKTVKSDKGGEYLTAILYLAPHTQNSMGMNVCPKATDGCAAACLYTAGRGQQKQVQDARIRKTDWFLTDRKGFMLQLNKELVAFDKRCKKLKVKAAVRLNGTSDLNWGKMINMSRDYPDIQFYDYTKIPFYVLRNKHKSHGHANYQLTLSRTEEDTNQGTRDKLKLTNVAVVFAEELPKTYLGHVVINGDLDDLRFLDKGKRRKNVVVGLSAKGAAKKDTSGFVVNNLTRQQYKAAAHSSLYGSKKPIGDAHLQIDMFAA